MQEVGYRLIESSAIRIGAVVTVVVAVGLLALFFQNTGSSDTPGSGNNAGALLGAEADPSNFVTKSGAHAAEADISFSDNDPVRITWRQPPFLGYKLEPEDRGYKSLSARAEAGDEIAAYLLSELMNRCSTAFETQEEMEAAIDWLQQTQTIVYPDSVQEIGIANPEKHIPVAIQHIRALFETCSGITAEQKSESGIWLQRSADVGFLPALMELAYKEENHETAIRLFTQAWEIGDSEALKGLSERYYANWQSGVEPNDKVRAYASLYLYTRISEAGMGPGTGHGEIAARQLARIQETLDRATTDMLSHELDEAIEIARSMIESNSHCCFGI